MIEESVKTEERRDRDSNPGWACTHSGFQDRRLKPLGHPSGLKESII